MEIGLFNWYLTTDKIKTLIRNLYDRDRVWRLTSHSEHFVCMLRMTVMLKDVSPNTEKIFMIQWASVHSRYINCCSLSRADPKCPPGAHQVLFHSPFLSRAEEENAMEMLEG